MVLNTPLSGFPNPSVILFHEMIQQGEVITIFKWLYYKASILQVHWFYQELFVRVSIYHNFVTLQIYISLNRRRRMKPALFVTTHKVIAIYN